MKLYIPERELWERRTVDPRQPAGRRAETAGGEAAEWRWQGAGGLGGEGEAGEGAGGVTNPGRGASGGAPCGAIGVRGVAHRRVRFL